MSTTRTDRLIDDYLRRLDAAAAHLQRSRRNELVAEIREHIEAALRQEEAAGEAAVRNVLERLGPPEEIVDAAEPAAAAPGRPRALDLVALLAFLVPIAGWLVGIVLVLASDAWARRDKAIGIALGLLPLLAPLLTISTGADSGGALGEPVPAGAPGPAGAEEPEDEGAGSVLAVAFLLLAGLPAAAFLGWRLRRHPRTRS